MGLHGEAAPIGMAHLLCVTVKPNLLDCGSTSSFQFLQIACSQPVLTLHGAGRLAVVHAVTLVCRSVVVSEFSKIRENLESGGSDTCWYD